MIYFIQSGGYLGPIKIGLSSNPVQRVHDLQVGNPEELTLLAVMVGEESEEARLHARFSKHHIRGEWFKPSDSIWSLIDRLNAG